MDFPFVDALCNGGNWNWMAPSGALLGEKWSKKGVWLILRENQTGTGSLHCLVTPHQQLGDVSMNYSRFISNSTFLIWLFLLDWKILDEEKPFLWITQSLKP